MAVGFLNITAIQEGSNAYNLSIFAKTYNVFNKSCRK